MSKAEVDEKVAGLLANIDQAIAAVQGEIGKSLSNVKRDAILDHLKKLRDTVGAGIPWVAQQFAEQMEATVEHGKIEVEAYIQNAVQRAGLQALAASGDLPLQLGAGKPKDPV